MTTTPTESPAMFDIEALLEEVPAWRPARGGLTLTLGALSAALPLVFGGFGVPIVLGVLAIRLASAEQAGMEAGLVDPAGHRLVSAGQVLASAGVLLGVAGACFSAAMVLLWTGPGIR